MDALKVAFEIIPNEKGMVSISKIAKNYSALSEEREKFLQKFSTVLENYLVNEFFLNCHPFKFYNTLIFNYGFFVTNYKMLEFLALAISVIKDFTEKDLISQIIWYVHRMDHNIGYSNKISDYLREQNDLVKIMRSMLQV